MDWRLPGPDEEVRVGEHRPSVAEEAVTSASQASARHTPPSTATEVTSVTVKEGS